MDYINRYKRIPELYWKTNFNLVQVMNYIHIREWAYRLFMIKRQFLILGLSFFVFENKHRILNKKVGFYTMYNNTCARTRARAYKHGVPVFIIKNDSYFIRRRH